METSIQVSRTLLEKLKGLKRFSKESYEEIIWDLIEDRMELSEETKSNIKISEEQILKGDVVGFDEIKRKYKL